MTTKFYTFLFFVVTLTELSSAQQQIFAKGTDSTAMSHPSSDNTYINVEAPQLSPPANPKDIFEAVGLRILTDLRTSSIYITVIYTDIPINILITNITGEIICHRELQPREDREMIDLSNYARGIYHIEISIGNEKQMWKLILK